MAAYFDIFYIGSSMLSSAKKLSWGAKLRKSRKWKQSTQLNEHDA